MTNIAPLTADNVTAIAPVRGDITFTHSVFAQCFLPLRKLPNNAKRHTVKHGNSSLLIKAGELINPKTKEYEEQDVPYGSAGRIALAHIHNHIIRSPSIEEAQEVPMGDSLRDFFKNHRLAYGGKNGKQIRQQINNIASAHITIGIWNDVQTKQINVPTLAKEIDFWLEKDDQQRSLWQPTMTLNREYVEAIREYRVPLDMRALIGLYEKPRAMDIFTWLSYRLPMVKNPKGVFIPYFGENGLHGIFGQSIVSKRKFKQVFTESIKEACKFYPSARLSFEDKGIRIFNSPSPIPSRSEIGNQKSLFFVDNA